MKAKRPFRVHRRKSSASERRGFHARTPCQTRRPHGRRRIRLCRRSQFRPWRRHRRFGYRRMPPLRLTPTTCDQTRRSRKRRLPCRRLTSRLRDGATRRRQNSTRSRRDSPPGGRLRRRRTSMSPGSRRHSALQATCRCTDHSSKLSHPILYHLL